MRAKSKAPRTGPSTSRPALVAAASAGASEGRSRGRKGRSGPAPAPCPPLIDGEDAAIWREAGIAFAKRFWGGHGRRPTPAEVAFAFVLLHKGNVIGELGGYLAAFEPLGSVAELEQGADLAELQKRPDVGKRLDVSDAEQDPNDPLLGAFSAGVSAADAEQLANDAEQLANDAGQKRRTTEIGHRKQLELFPEFCSTDEPPETPPSPSERGRTESHQAKHRGGRP